MELRTDKKKLGLHNVKDLEMRKLQGTINREQLILWRDGLHELLENTPGWSHSTETLGAVRSWATDDTTEGERHSR